ncbi:ATP-grasp domain-containing protein [Vulgatibacter incomptus]|uniref:Ribosomal protein S6 glutaminyl transferase n=1 Tax=Vulgatibacter incomptus TaxID=1391653 RepID=A0A0K1PF04_9BACT|nr:RimK family alpha-L-glutamate ligase [Vulgatibacter incomptus]AKU91694.1 Ribosomal protein S6 glutaminyl transferase [Vulgatibacter incomptus]
MRRASPIRLLILSRSASIYSTRRLVEAARASGITVRVLDPVDCEMHLDGKRPHLYYRRKPVPAADVVIPRIAQSIAPFGLAVVNHLALTGAVLLNDAESIARSRNKMRSLQLLAGNGICVPPTLMARDPRAIKEMVPLVGGVPVLVKLLQGGERQGVMVCETMHSLEAALEAILGLGQNLVVQQYVQDAKDKDLRALVVGGRVVCAVRRIPKVGRMRRTLGKGAKFEPVKLPSHFVQTAVRAARLMDLELAAVDMLDHEGRAEVFEVHSSPGLKDLEDATGLDLATPIVEHAARLVRLGRAEKRAHPPLPQPPRAEELGGEGARKGRKAR